MNGPEFKSREEARGFPLFQDLQFGYGIHPAFCSLGTAVLSSVDHPLHIAPKLKPTAAYPLFTLRASMSWSRDSSVGIATRYRLDGPGIESRLEAKFSAPIHTGSEAYPASYTMGTGSFPGLKRPGRGLDHPPYLGPRLKEE
jgi:hypothetical protein